MKKQIIQLSSMFIVAAAFSIGVSYIFAWTVPTMAPPGGNVVAPLNVGPDDQDKEGDICSTKNGFRRCLTDITPPESCSLVYDSVTNSPSTGAWYGTHVLSPTVSYSPAAFNTSSNSIRAFLTSVPLPSSCSGECSFVIKQEVYRRLSEGGRIVKMNQINFFQSASGEWAATNNRSGINGNTTFTPIFPKYHLSSDGNEYFIVVGDDGSIIAKSRTDILIKDRSYALGQKIYFCDDYLEANSEVGDNVVGGE